jgi:hypothetical protein
MRVAVLGGGFQGCCVALALSMRGINVTIFDRGSSLMNRTAIANEGKVHLGYMYAADRSLETAKMMIEGALAFGPFISRALERPQGAFITSQPTVYVVHRDSQHAADEAVTYLKQTHQLIAERSNGSPDTYFGQDLRRPLAVWTRDIIAGEFDPNIAAAVVQTPEIAIDPIDVMAQIRTRIDMDPLIEVRLAHEVEGITRGGQKMIIHGSTQRDAFAEGFDQAVNALWEGRLAIDAKMGLAPKRPWLHRLKFGIKLKSPGPDKAPRSCTVISGPFGEVVNYPDGTIYLTWYPHCVREFSSDVTPPLWDTHPRSEVSRKIVVDTVSSMSQFIWKLGELGEEQISGAQVKGGPIFAWGKTDIYDPESELHRRYDIGILSEGAYHSIDPGKLTMAPFFADACAERVVAVGMGRVSA